MTGFRARVARHGRSTVLIVPPAEARRLKLVPGQHLRVETQPDEPETPEDEPFLGSWKRMGIRREDFDAALEDTWPE